MEARYESTATQIVASLVASAVMLSSGMSVGYPSVALKSMSEDRLVNSPSQEAWVAGTALLTMAVGCLVSGPLLDIFGRKFGLICASLPAAIGWALTGLAGNKWTVYSGRALTGLACGFSGAATASYVAEIASPKLRSALTVFRTVAFSLGTALVFMFGMFYQKDWGIVALLCGIFPLVSFLLIVFWLPESATWLRRPPTTPAPPAAWIARREVWLPLLIINFLLILRQISGTALILSNAVRLVEGSGVPKKNSHFVVFLIGSSRVGAGLIAAWLSGRLGRRRPVTYSGTSMSAAVLALAAALETPEDLYSGPPKIFLLVTWVWASCIFGAVSQSMVGELFPTDVRGVCSAICSFVTAITAFAAVMSYEWMEKGGFSGVYRVFGIFSVSATILAILFLPETHGKTLDEISQMFMITPKQEDGKEEDIESAEPLNFIEFIGSEESCDKS